MIRLILSLLVALAGAGALTAAPMPIDSGFQKSSTMDFAEIIVAPAASLDLNRARQRADWRPVQKRTVRHGWLRQEIWLRYTLSNPTTRTQEIVITQTAAREDFVDYYLLDEEGSLLAAQQGGDSSGRRQLTPPFLRPAFALSIPPAQSRTIVSRVQNAVDADAEQYVYTRLEFNRHAARSFATQWAFLGAGAVLLLLFGITTATVKTRLPLHFLVYLLLVQLYFALVSGLLEYILGPLPPWLVNEGNIAIVGVIYAVGVRFVRTFLELPQASRSIDRALLILQFLALLPLPLAFISREASRFATDTFSALGGPAVLIAGVVMFRSSTRARYFVAAWSLPIFVAALSQITPLGDEPGQTIFYQQLSLLIGFAIYGVAIGREVRTLIETRVAAQTRVDALERDLNQAREFHAGLLPRLQERYGPLETDLYYSPESQLGGDYYDLVELPDGRMIALVADVTGHGLAAALDASSVRLAFRTSFRHCRGAGDLLTRMNAIMAPHINYRFVTAVCLVIDLARQRVEAACAGHPPPMLLDAAGNVQLRGPEAVVLGMDPAAIYPQIEFDFRPGDRIVLYTDGLYENALTPDKEPLQLLTDCLQSQLDSRTPVNAATVAGAMESLRGGGQSDDITLFMLKYTDADGSPAQNDQSASHRQKEG